MLIKLQKDPEFEETVETVVKIEKYLRSKDWSSQPETVRAIVEMKRAELNSLESLAKRLLERSIEGARYFVNGNEISPSGSSASEKIRNALIQLVRSVYRKIDLAKRQYDERDFKNLLVNPDLCEACNLEASHEILEMLPYMDNPTVSEVADRFQKKPYGWPKSFTKAVILTLLFKGEIELLYGSELLRPSSRGFLDKILKEREAEKVRIRKKEKVRKEILDSVKSLVHDLFSMIDLPDDQDELARVFMEKSRDLLRDLEQKLKECEKGFYKFCDPLKYGIELLKFIPLDGPSHIVLRKTSEISTELIKWKESSRNVLNFFEENSNQRKILDSGRAIIEKVANVKDLISFEEVKQDIESLEKILESEKPFSEIHKIPELGEKIESFLEKVLEEEKEKLKKEYSKKVQSALKEKRDVVREKIFAFIENAGDIKTLLAMTRKFDEMIEEASRNELPEDTSGAVKKGRIKPLNLSSIVGRRIVRNEKDIDELVNAIRKKLEEEISRGYEIEIEG